MVTGSNPVAATSKTPSFPIEQGTTENSQAFPHAINEQGISLKQAIDGFLLTCKVEGKSYGTIDCYSTKLKCFLWYANNYNLPDNVNLITTQHLREFLVYVRETPHRWGSNSFRAKQPVNSTTVQKYYRALSVLFGWLINEELLTYNPLLKIKVPKAEKKIIKAISYEEVNKILASFSNSFEGKRNRAIILVLVDCGLRLGELLSLTMDNLNMEQQLLKVLGKTGERIVRFGRSTAKALLKYLMARQRMNATSQYLWITSKDTGLKSYGIETMFSNLSKKTGVRVHPHLLRHTFATLWLKNGGDSLMLQRLLGYTTLMMTNRYCPAVGCYDAIESHKKYSPEDRLRG